MGSTDSEPELGTDRTIFGRKAESGRSHVWQDAMVHIHGITIVVAGSMVIVYQMQGRHANTT